MSAQLVSPAVQIGLSLFQGFKPEPFERRVLGMPHAPFHLPLAIGIAHPAGQGDGAIVRQHVVVKRVHRWIVDVRLEHAFAEIVEHDGARGAAQPAEGPLMEFGPRACTRLKGEEPDRFPAVAQRKHKQASSPVAAGGGVPDHGSGAIVDLGLLSWRRGDDGAGFRRGGT